MNVGRGSCDLHTGWLRTVRAGKDTKLGIEQGTVRAGKDPKLGRARDGKSWEGP